MIKLGINHTTIIEPYLFFYYLEQLGKLLAKQGFSNLLFQVYNCQLIVINSVLRHEQTETTTKLVSLTTYVRLKLINLCVELNCIQAVAFHQQLLADLLTSADPASPTATASTSPASLLKLLQIDPVEACLVREQIYAHKQRLSHMKDEEALLEAQSGGKIYNDMIVTIF